MAALELHCNAPLLVRRGRSRNAGRSDSFSGLPLQRAREAQAAGCRKLEAQLHIVGLKLGVGDSVCNDLNWLLVSPPPRLMLVKFKSGSRSVYARRLTCLLQRGTVGRSTNWGQSMKYLASAMIVARHVSLCPPMRMTASPGQPMLTPAECGGRMPLGLPPGTKVTVIEGPMNEAVPFTIRV